MNELHICRVCGFDAGEPLWENDIPHYIICSCCGSASGNEDYILESIQFSRKNWMENGCKWFYPSEKPDNWNLDNQLAQIPVQWK